MTMYWFHPEKGILAAELDNHCKVKIEPNGTDVKITVEKGDIVNVDRKENVITVTTSPRAA